MRVADEDEARNWGCFAIIAFPFLSIPIICRKNRPQSLHAFKIVSQRQLADSPQFIFTLPHKYRALAVGKEQILRRYRHSRYLIILDLGSVLEKGVI
jgi:hypothetical protein